jgi:hypothetical protein
MISFETPISPLWLTLGALLALTVLGLSYSRLRRLVRPNYLWGLTALRLGACAAVFFLLLNPYRIDTQADRDGFRVAVLLDASGSMDTPDIAGGSRTRFDVVKEWLANDRDSPVAALRERGYRLDLFLFAEETVPLSGAEPRLLPGSTAMGNALREVMGSGRTGAGSQLGGVLLVSDGQSNAGPSPVEVAQEFRQRGIPISTIGIGSMRPPGEVQGQFAAPRFQGEKGAPLDLQVRLTNTRSSRETVQVELRHENSVLETRSVELPANSEQVLTFQVTPWQTGGQAYQVITRRAGAPDQNDVAAVHIHEPDTFRILYLAGRPSLEFRFLQQALATAEQISVEAVIRTGAESLFHLLRPEQEKLLADHNFPTDRRFYNGYDAIVFHESALAEFSERTALLRDFVQHRGGGLLFLGSGSEVPADWAGLLPVTEATRQQPVRRREIEVDVAPVFHEVAGGTLFGRPAPFLPDEVPAFLATEWKRGARPVVRLADGGGVLMGVQAYGAGRIGWLGTENTWRWRMQSATGLEQHRVFWNHLLVWLASSGRPRLNVGYQGERVPLASEMDAGIDVMGADFRPARQAEVDAVVRTPSGETRQVRLQPSFRQPGRFEMSYRPEEAGEHQVRYRIAFPEGEEISYDAFFIASHHNEERENPAYREDILRDLARITGGEFRTHEEARNLRDLPLAEGVPTRQTRHYLAQNWLFLLLLALPLFGEWYIRRKLGLK